MLQVSDDKVLVTILSFETLPPIMAGLFQQRGDYVLAVVG